MYPIGCLLKKPTEKILIVGVLVLYLRRLVVFSSAFILHKTFWRYDCGQS